MSEAGQTKPTKWRYVVTQGVLGWGIPFFLLMLGWDAIQAGGLPDGISIASLGCVSAFGGVVLGLWMWRDQGAKPQN